MSSTTGAGSYRALLRSRAVARVYVLSTLGRFGYAVLPLILLFTISQSSGSFAVAAAASAVFGFSGLLMPLQARLIDRFTQRRVLPPLGTVFAVTLVLMALAGARGLTSPSAWVALCLLAGVSAPSLGPSMRAQWRLWETGERRTTAYSLDAITEEVAFLTGPVAGSLVLATGPAWTGLLLVAFLVAVGLWGLATSPMAGIHEGQPGPRRAGGPWGPLRRPGFVALTTGMVLAGAGGAAALTGTAAQADALGHPEWAGLIEAAAGAAAVLGGLAWGRWRLRGPWSAHLAGLLVMRGLCMGVAVVVAGLAGTAIAMVLSGFLMAPMFVVAYTASDLLTPPQEHTEASTWVTAAHNVGTSCGTAAAGWAVAHVSTTAPFLASGVFLLRAPIPLVAGRRGRRSDSALGGGSAG